MNKIRIIFLVVTILVGLFLINSVSRTKPTVSEEKQLDDLQIYLLIGQSNMAGRAAIEIQEIDTLKNVYLYTGIVNKEWEKAANPLNKYLSVRKKLSMQKLGPGYSFAAKMANFQSDKTIGLVVNAKGGTSIGLWKPGSEFYKEAIVRTKKAMQFGVLKGVLWHQGESDASKYEAYLPQLVELIKALRSDLNAPNLPFVAGQLSNDKPGRSGFNEIIQQLPQHIDHVSVVTTENTSTIDSTHFDAASQRLLGSRYATEMIKLLNIK